MNGDFHVETAQERAEREGWLVVGTFPFGATYCEVEQDASTPTEWHDPNAPT